MKAFSRIVAMGALLITPSAALAHSGGLDANGCHAGSRPYHCHRAPSTPPQHPAPTVRPIHFGDTPSDESASPPKPGRALKDM